MSSKEMSLLGDVEMVGATSVTGDRGLRITSKAWPEARLFMGLTSMSGEQGAPAQTTCLATVSAQSLLQLQCITAGGRDGGPVF